MFLKRGALALVSVGTMPLWGPSFLQQLVFAASDRVERDDDGAWRVSGRNAERVVAMADLTNIEAMEYVQHRLRTMGVERALARAGAREGDIVRIGPVELDYVEGIG